MRAPLYIRRQGRAGRMTLNRPEALNALNLDMIRSISEALAQWVDDGDVSVVVIDATGARAFCAGGDVRELYAAALSGDIKFGCDFWREEYQLNALIANYPKPVVTLMHGIVMGGGVGLGCHASHRVVCETTSMAMPECAIGLVPDVGSTLILAQAPGHLGEYLGMTGAKMSGVEAITAGFADYSCAQEEWPTLVGEICNSGSPQILRTCAKPVGDNTPVQMSASLSAAFAKSTVSEILDACKNNIKADAALHAASPLSLAVTLRLIRQARTFGKVEEALEQEFRFTARGFEQSDFVEGVRAHIIDKDRKPKWRHAAAADVTKQEVDALLSPLPGNATVFGNQAKAIEGVTT